MARPLSRRAVLHIMAQIPFWAAGGIVSQSNDEFLGRLDFIKRLRELETRMARLERHPGGEIPTVAVGEPTQGEAAVLGGVPGLRHFNASHVNGFRAAADARPNSLLPLDPNANIDLRRAGGEIFGNRITAGYGDNTAIMDGVDATYRFWIGASAAASAAFRVTQTGEIEIGTGASIATIKSSPSPGVTTIDMSGSGAMLIGITAASGNLGGFLISEKTSRRWLVYHNNISGCTNQFDFYSYNTNANVLSIGFTGASSRFNTPLAMFDGAGGSQILDAAASGIAFGQNTHLTADKKHVLDGATGSVYFTYDAAASRVRLYVKGIQSASWN